MNLQDTFKTITERTATVGQQEGDISRKLECYKQAKEQAEAAKTAAREARDEQAYIDACRAVADAEAGIEFNSIVLRDMQHGKAATPEEDQAIKAALKHGEGLIYVDAINAIEKAMADLLDAAETAMKKFDSIDAMALAWDQAVMHDNSITSQLKFTRGNREIIIPYIGLVKGRLNVLREGKKVNPLFRGDA